MSKKIGQYAMKQGVPHPAQRPDLYIGIDPGVNTGIAVYDPIAKELVAIQTCKIHIAWEMVSDLSKKTTIHVVVEDARKIKLPRSLQKHEGRGYDQGVGSVKRDCSAWSDFLTDLEVSFEMKDPRQTTKKLDRAVWEKITGYTGRTSEHARDAAMLVWGK